jgi:predicted RNA-binding protein YlxR (DUF448 family)
MRTTPAKRRPATPDPTEGDPRKTDPGEIDGDEPETGPLRRCAVTRERLPKERMIRFVIGPDRSVVPDLAATLPGRGIWLSARGDVVETATTRGAFAKAARGSVIVSPDLRSGLQAALARRVSDHLGLARRAGQAVAGFAKAREWLASGRAALVVQARDGSPEERQRFLGGWDGPVVAPLDAVRMGAVFGREHVVHVAIAHGRLAETLKQEAGRLAGLEAGTDSDAGARARRSGSVRRTDKASDGVGRNDAQTTDVQDTGG